MPLYGCKTVGAEKTRARLDNTMDERMKHNTQIQQTTTVEKNENNSTRQRNIEVKSENNTTMGLRECTMEDRENLKRNNPTMNRSRE
jgi:hypothetical protein